MELFQLRGVTRIDVLLWDAWSSILTAGEMLTKREPQQHPIWEYPQLHLHAPHAATKTCNLYCILTYYQ
jgi:hypothetical protein